MLHEMIKVSIYPIRVFDPVFVSRFEELREYVAGFPYEVMHLDSAGGTHINGKFFPSYLYVDCEENLLILRLKFSEMIYPNGKR